jgi:hypothetical protein
MAGKHRAQSAIASIPPQLLGVAAAIEIKRVVKMPLAAEGFLVVVALGGGEPLEPFRDRLKARDSGVRSRRGVSAPRTINARRPTALSSTYIS